MYKYNYDRKESGDIIENIFLIFYVRIISNYYVL